MGSGASVRADTVRYHRENLPASEHTPEPGFYIRWMLPPQMMDPLPEWEDISIERTPQPADQTESDAEERETMWHDDDENDMPSIDEIANSMGFDIDEDGHWVPHLAQ